MVAAVVVPASLSSIVIVSQYECIESSSVTLGILNGCYSVELLTDCALNDLVLLILMQLSSVIKVQLVVVVVRYHHFGLLHVQTNWKDSLEGEVWVFNVPPVYFLILVEQIGVLEFLDWLLCNF